MKLSNRRDYLFITILVVLAGIPLLESRLQQPPSLNSPLLMVCFLLFLVAAWVWLHGSPPIARKSHMVRVDAGHTLLIAALFLGFTIVAFYLPMRLRYWVGWDDTEVLRRAFGSLWSSAYDAGWGRPLIPFFDVVASTITSSFHGFLWVATASRFLTALLVWRVMHLVSPKLSWVGLAAGILFIANPAEASRYTLLMSHARGAVMLVWLAVWLFLYSYLTYRRIALILSLCLYGIAILAYESSLSQLPLFLLMFLIPKANHRWIYLYGLLSTTSVFALRFALFFLLGQSYQRGLISFLESTPISIASIARYLQPTLNYFLPPPVAYFTLGLVPASVVPIIFLVYLRTIRTQQALYTPELEMRLPSPPTLLSTAILLAIGGIIVSVAPFFILTGTTGTYRSQYFAEPYQSLLFASLIALFISRVRVSMKHSLFAALCAVLVWLALGQAYYFQKEIEVVRPPASLTTIKRTLTNADAVLPPPRQDTFYFFVQSQEDSSPFAAYQELTYLSCMVWGVPAYQGEYTPTGLLVNLYGAPNYGRDWAQSRLFADPSLKVIFLSISAQGDVELLNLPTPDLTPPDDVKIPDILVRSTAERCAPMRDVHINDPLRFLQVSP